MPRDEAGVRAQLVLPARAGDLPAGGVEADPRHLHVDVARDWSRSSPTCPARARPTTSAAPTRAASSGSPRRRARRRRSPSSRSPCRPTCRGRRPTGTACARSGCRPRSSAARPRAPRAAGGRCRWGARSPGSRRRRRRPAARWSVPPRRRGSGFGASVGGASAAGPDGSSAGRVAAPAEGSTTVARDLSGQRRELGLRALDHLRRRLHRGGRGRLELLPAAGGEEQADEDEAREPHVNQYAHARTRSSRPRPRGSSRCARDRGARRSCSGP